MTQPKAGRRGGLDHNVAVNAAKGAPYSRAYQASMGGRMEAGRMPQNLNDFLRWYSRGWDAEVPTALHRSDLYEPHRPEEDKRGRCTCEHTGTPHRGECCHYVDGAPIHAAGGFEPLTREMHRSGLGTRAHTDQFRRYTENLASETDDDGYYLRPIHAALSRMSNRWPLSARALWAVAIAGYDWRGVGARGGWADEMFALYLWQAFKLLWHEYRDQVVRLT